MKMGGFLFDVGVTSLVVKKRTFFFPEDAPLWPRDLFTFVGAKPQSGTFHGPPPAKTAFFAGVIR